MEAIANEKTIAELVTEDFRRAGVFRKYGIDFCCGGKKPLQTVATEKNLDLDKIEADLRSIDASEADRSKGAKDWTAAFLADYIVQVHHSYVRTTSPNLVAWSQKVATRHGDRFAYLDEVRQIVQSVVNELDSHMFKEEHILFPYVKALEEARSKGEISSAPFGTVANPIRMMEHEHEEVGQMITRLQEITSNYTPPPDACNTFRVLFSTLKEFEDDLFLHIHLENNILFPKALNLEKSGNK